MVGGNPAWEPGCVAMGGQWGLTHTQEQLMGAPAATPQLREGGSTLGLATEGQAHCMDLGYVSQ